MENIKFNRDCRFNAKVKYKNMLCILQTHDTADGIRIRRSREWDILPRYPYKFSPFPGKKSVFMLQYQQI